MATRERHHDGSISGHRSSLPPACSPAKWDLDRGRPSWIRALPGSSWTTVFEWELGFGHIFRLEMPTLVRAATNGSRVPTAGSEAIRRAAGLRDICRCNHEYIGRHARLAADGRELARTTAKQRVGQGREILYGLGVLPWSVFDPAGRLPKRWWRERGFVDALEEWEHQPPQLPVNVIALAVRTAGMAAERLQQELRPAQALRAWRAIAGR